MSRRFKEHSGTAALVISIISLIVASSGVADAARHAIVSAVTGAGKPAQTAQSSAAAQETAGAGPVASAAAKQAKGDKAASKKAASKKASAKKPVGKKAKSNGADAQTVDGHRIASKPYPDSLLLLNANGKIPASALPTVKEATDAGELGGKTLEDVEPSCPPDTANLGTWCLEASPYPLTNQDEGLNNYFWASQTCVEAGGYLPSDAQLIGAAKHVKLDSTIHDNPDTATIDEDPTVGLKDLREMSATLVTTAAGSEAAGSEGVSEGSTGDPRTGEPDPVPEPADPEPETLQYVDVYSNGTKGGFAGSQPVSEPQSFRCAYNEMPGANASEETS